MRLSLRIDVDNRGSSGIGGIVMEVLASSPHEPLESVDLFAAQALECLARFANNALAHAAKLVKDGAM